MTEEYTFYELPPEISEQLPIMIHNWMNNVMPILGARIREMCAPHNLSEKEQWLILATALKSVACTLEGKLIKQGIVFRDSKTASTLDKKLKKEEAFEH
jgi:hypothetical protein